MARITNNLDLNVWNLFSDTFSHVELADNWDKIDAHNHDGVNGGLPLATGSVGSTQLANGGVTIAKVGARPQARITHSTTQNIGINTWMVIAFDTTVYDTGATAAQHSNTVSNSRLTCRDTGLYSITASIRISGQVGYRILELMWMGSTLARAQGVPIGTTDGTTLNLAVHWRFTAGEWIELQAYSSDTANQTLLKSGSAYPLLSMVWLAP